MSERAARLTFRVWSDFACGLMLGENRAGVSDELRYDDAPDTLPECY